jgi:hypothetical protein
MINFSEIEHGVLRGNQKSPNPFLLGRPFGEKDPRISLAFKIVDPRVHFALVCGAKSCPPIRFFNAENLENGLKLAAESFCNDDGNVQILTTEKKVFHHFHPQYILTLSLFQPRFPYRKSSNGTSTTLRQTTQNYFNTFSPI